MITEVTEDYVIFEIAILLKKKGFDIPCEFQYINCASGVPFLIDKRDESGCYYKNSEIGDDEYSAPTLQMVMKWLREVYGLHICIFIGEDFSCDADGNTVDMWYFWSYYITNLCSDVVYDAYDKLNCVEYQSFEEACEAAIKYCLTNLI